MAKKKKKYDGRKNLIPLNKRTKAERKAIQRKGGRVKSLAKQRASEIRKILNDPKIKGTVKNRIRMLANRDYLGLLNDILATNVKNLNSDKKRLQVIDRILKILPQKNINISAVRASGFGDEEDIEKLDEFIKKVLDNKK